MRLKMCSIHVQDPAAAHSFYTETLGFDTLMAMPEHNLFIVRDPGASGTVGLLLEPSDNPIASAYSKGLYDAGVQFRGEPAEDPSGLSAVFDDGCGNYIQLHQD